ncbi:probable bifunctional dTTP/UTP pyrophosphatase/methyltransferase protein isoform X2 [Dermacentor silvarum]|uniref:probable bifunctional dTTP/UTP pyrophosphatase/methyltransferase protein isoform X2 n=1 Tax=Dermacentor silvarum TaxID=543639 RepID=UPI00210154D8|nr:probable bifunctional dTTP/UTP pyrophosphatase/methyltransferase protein isoform X2 [Dermacentor silvarum]
MLEPLLCALDKKRIVLASASPRRKEILNMLGFRYDVVASSFEENLDKDAFTTPAEYCVRTAEGKARDVARVLQEKNEAVDLVIGADTIVVKGNSLYEKPKDSSDAERMLNELSGAGHFVQTGVALIYRCKDVIKLEPTQSKGKEEAWWRRLSAISTMLWASLYTGSARSSGTFMQDLEM